MPDKIPDSPQFDLAEFSFVHLFWIQPFRRAMMFRKRLLGLKYVLYAILVLVFSFCALEVGLRIYDSRTGKISGTDQPTSLILAESWTTHHQLKPLLKLHIKNPDTGEFALLRTNSIGLRGEEVAIPKPPGVFRIICLGDETTLAPATDEKNTSSVLLARMLQKKSRQHIEVINAGVPGFCPLLSYLQVKHHLLQLEPDLLILNIDMSDVADDHRYRRYLKLDAAARPLVCSHPALREGKTTSFDQAQKRCLILSWCKLKWGAISESMADQAENSDIDSVRGTYAWLSDHPPDWSMYIDQALSPIEELQRLAYRMDIGLILAISPAPWQVAAQASNHKSVRTKYGVPQNTVFRSEKPFEIIQNYARKRRIPIVNPLGTFRKNQHPEKLYLFRSARFSPSGHQVFAKSLAETIWQEIPSLKNGLANRKILSRK